MKKKLLLFLFIFLTFGKLSMASSRLPNGAIPNERLMNNLRGAIRVLNAYFGTNKEQDLQNEARDLITKVLRNEKFHDHAILAFDDTDRERLDSYNKAISSGDQFKIRVMKKGVEDNKKIRRQFGL